MTRASRDEIDAQAWRWVMRMDAEGWNDAAEAELEAWLAVDPRRHGALLQAEAMWEAVGTVGAASAAIDDGGGEDPPRFDRRRLMIGGGAAIAASVAGGLLLPGAGKRYETGVGEILRVPLADGSMAAINTASRIAVQLNDDRRNVRIDRGEAWFQVARNPARPFTVEAGRVRARAVGTAFSVRRREGGAEILVTEGIVEGWADGADGNKVRLTAGQRAFIADNARISSATAGIASVDRVLAWRDGKVDFVDRPIAEAMEEFNRYNRRQFVLLDPGVGRERFDGVFRTNDPEGFSRAIRDSLGVAVDLSDPATIRVGGPR